MRLASEASWSHVWGVGTKESWPRRPEGMATGIVNDPVSLAPTCPRIPPAAFPCEGLRFQHPAHLPSGSMRQTAGRHIAQIPVKPPPPSVGPGARGSLRGGRVADGQRSLLLEAARCAQLARSELRAALGLDNVLLVAVPRQSGRPTSTKRDAEARADCSISRQTAPRAGRVFCTLDHTGNRAPAICTVASKDAATPDDVRTRR